jgi:hypothetical protein
MGTSSRKFSLKRANATSSPQNESAIQTLKRDVPPKRILNPNMISQTFFAIIGFSGTELLILSVSLLFMALWIWMLVDCVKRISGGDSRQIGWLIVILLANVLGAFAYCFFGRSSRR